MGGGDWEGVQSHGVVEERVYSDPGRLRGDSCLETLVQILCIFLYMVGFIVNPSSVPGG